MIQFKTAEDVRKYFNGKECLPTAEFQEGAEWAIKTNEEYINYLLKRISGLNNKIKELNDQITDYEVIYCGAEPSVTKKTRKKGKSLTSIEDERDEMLAEMESMYGVSQDDDDDYSSYDYED
jgi:flagellar hook-associated protein FlgK